MQNYSILAENITRDLDQDNKIHLYHLRLYIWENNRQSERCVTN